MSGSYLLVNLSQSFNRVACSHSEIILGAALLLPSLLLFCLLVLCCNIGGALDCIYAAHRRKQQREARLLDLEAGVPLLPPTAAPAGPSQQQQQSAGVASPSRSNILSPQSSRPFGFRTQQPSASSSSRSQLLSPSSSGGRYQHARPFGDPSKNGFRSTA